MTSGGKRKGAGRKPPDVAKVRLSTWVLPSTKAFFGSNPGDALDKLVDRIKEDQSPS
jgi:hypothetical protein